MNDFQNLDFEQILNTIASFAGSEVTAKKILQTAPTTDIKLADKLLALTGEALCVLASYKPSLQFDDISVSLEKARVGAVLSPSEFLKIKNAVSAFRSLKKCVDSAPDCDLLKDIIAWARTCDDLEYDIDKVIENENEIKDGASEKLLSLRRSILRANAKLKEKLSGFTNQGEYGKYLRDNIVTVRNGRYVLPVRSDCRSHIKGLVHDISSTGATVFIEPFAVFDANNELITLKTEESNEIERILIELTQKVVSQTPELVKCIDVLTECGVIFAKAEYAKNINAFRPILNDDGKIVLKSARHPLIARESVVPVDITLDEKRVLLISGPNTGGKTVALKTVGLFALLAACGIFIPAAEGSIIGVFDSVYCDIGDSQSIAQSLSTFSAHVVNLSRITSEMNDRSLVLLDEVGDGTDPDEGAALAVAVIKKILLSRATAVITTHFNSVKEFALGCHDIANACMQFDSVNFKPTYRLLQGVSGSSYALEIAEKLGLDGDIIKDARAALSDEKIKFDTIMREAEKLRNDVLSEKQLCESLSNEARENAQKAQALKQQYEKKLEEINENSRSIIRRRVDEYAAQAEAIIDEIKAALKSADEAALFNARKSAKKLTDGVPYDEIKPRISKSPTTPDKLSVGAAVFVNGLNKEGIVASIRGNKAVVAIGSVKTELPIASLSIIQTERKKQQNRSVKTERDPVNQEVMMLGMTVDDATLALERIIADLPPHSTLRIVHGKGTGALGKGIQQFLKRTPRVKEFRYGRYGEGDTGVTIIEIK